MARDDAQWCVDGQVGSGLICTLGIVKFRTALESSSSIELLSLRDTLGLSVISVLSDM